MAIGTTLKISFDGKSVQRGLSKMGDSIAGLGKRFAQIGLGTVTAGAAAATAGFIAFAKSASDAAAENESLSTSFTVLTGDAKKAKDMLEEIRDFGATTPLEQKDLQESAKTLLAFGVALDDVMPTLRMLGDISMGNAERLRSLALVFGQVSSAGKLTGGDLLQFINVGFNPLNEIAKRTGESMSDLRDKMSKGQITTAMVKQAFIDATGAGGKFNNMLAIMANTTEGKLSNLSDNIAAIKISFGRGFNDGLRVAVDAVNAGLPQLLEKFRIFGERVGAIISDSVNGNFDKLAAVGKLIGDVLAAAATAAFQAGASNIFTGVANELTGNRRVAVGPGGEKTVVSTPGQIQSNTFQDLFDAQLILRGVSQQIKDVSTGLQGLVPGSGGRFRYAGPGESTTLRDAAGNRVVEVLQKIERNTQGGAKM